MRVGIVGGGWMGMYLAYLLTDQAIVTVYEKAPQAGGLSTFHHYGEFYWDRFYHVVLPTDKFLLSALSKIGLENQVKWRETRTGYFVDRKVHELSSTKDFVFFPPLTLWQKFRLGLTIIKGSRINNWHDLEKISVEDWLIKYSGKKTFEKFWKPLLLAKLGENYRRVSAVFIWSYIKRLFGARDSSAKKEQMGFIAGGYKAVFDKLQHEIERKGSDVLLNSVVNHISATHDDMIQIDSTEGVQLFDKVIFTCPSGLINKIVSPALAEMRVKHPVEYLGVICVVVVTKKEISPYYVLNIADPDIAFTGVIGMTTVVDRDQTNGRHVLYLPKYLLSTDRLFTSSDDEIQDLFIPGLKKIFTDFRDSDIESIHVNRAKMVQPLQVLNYSEIIPDISTNHPNFYILNTSQFTNDTLNNNTVAQHVDRFVSQFFPAVNQNYEKPEIESEYIP